MLYPHEPCFEGVLYQGPGGHAFPGRSRRVSVLVDNRFDQRTHPVHQLKFDWYQGGAKRKFFELAGYFLKTKKKTPPAVSVSFSLLGQNQNA